MDKRFSSLTFQPFATNEDLKRPESAIRIAYADIIPEMELDYFIKDELLRSKLYGHNSLTNSEKGQVAECLAALFAFIAQYAPTGNPLVEYMAANARTVAFAVMAEFNVRGEESLSDHLENFIRFSDRLAPDRKSTKPAKGDDTSPDDDEDDLGEEDEG